MEALKPDIPFSNTEGALVVSDGLFTMPLPLKKNGKASHKNYCVSVLAERFGSQIRTVLASPFALSAPLL